MCDIRGKSYSTANIGRCMEKMVGELTDKKGVVTEKVGVYTASLIIGEFRNFFYVAFYSSLVLVLNCACKGRNQRFEFPCNFITFMRDHTQ